MSRDILEAVETRLVLDWHRKRDLQRDIRSAVKHRLTDAGCPRDKLSPLADEIMNLALRRIKG
jgi:hypothetical protein